MRTAIGATSCNSATESAPSIFSAGVVVGSPNNAVNLTWTLPPAALGAITGYCIFRNTTPTFNSSPRNIFVSGASTSSFTDTGFAGCCDSTPPINLMQSSHRFTPTSLGINTTNPQSNLDVNGSAAVNSLNLVQKAERFAGADAGAKTQRLPHCRRKHFERLRRARHDRHSHRRSAHRDSRGHRV